MTSQALASRPMENEIMADHVYASMYAFMDAHFVRCSRFLGKTVQLDLYFFLFCLGTPQNLYSK